MAGWMTETGPSLSLVPARDTRVEEVAAAKSGDRRQCSPPSWCATRETEDAARERRP